MEKKDPHAATDRPFNLITDLPLSIIAGQMWLYAFSVLYPARVLKSMGWHVKNELGNLPSTNPCTGEGQFYCRNYLEPQYLDTAPVAYELVEDFDRIASMYETYVRPFSRPAYEETLRLLQPRLKANARILDPSCGPGTEMLQLSALVPEGEVVGMDLSAGMIATAFENARRQKIRNVAFFQADVAKMPEHFAGRFDIVFCSFAFHHYPNPFGAVQEMWRVLNDSGRVFLLDPGPWWFTMLGAPLAKWADPGWIGFHTGEELHALFSRAGFSDFYWSEILPGIGLCIGTK